MFFINYFLEKSALVSQREHSSTNTIELSHKRRCKGTAFFSITQAKDKKVPCFSIQSVMNFYPDLFLDAVSIFYTRLQQKNLTIKNIPHFICESLEWLFLQ